jgi:hypothetical protein
MHRFAEQPGLFDSPANSPNASLVDQLDEHPGEEFIQGIRDELCETLALARGSDSFPWADLTQTYMVEMRFNSMSRWLARPEAVALRKAFAAEMDQLYEAAGEMRPEVPGPDPD